MNEDNVAWFSRFPAVCSFISSYFIYCYFDFSRKADFAFVRSYPSSIVHRLNSYWEMFVFGERQKQLESVIVIWFRKIHNSKSDRSPNEKFPTD